ncbi:hypothetical protein ABZX74_05350 [Streptomyces olivaceoviridis]|uniref:hypothetical protein n=1 Tax=Streptomyces olivaceoviridis TaxID=1921 RepID=UPI0033B3669D
MGAEDRAQVAAVIDVVLAAVDVAATIFVMNEGDRFPRRHLLAEARAPPPPRPGPAWPGRRDPCPHDRIVATAIATHCLDISEPKTSRDLEPGYGLYTARRALSDLPARRPPTPAPGSDR